MEIIAVKTHEIFEKFKESLISGKPDIESIETLVKGLINIADKNVKFQHHRDILDNEVERQFQLIKEE